MMPRLVEHHRLLVSPLVFTLSWWLVVALHTLNGLLVLVNGGIYLYFSRDAAYASISRLQDPQYVLQLTGWSFLAIALLHGDTLVRLVVRSVRARQLTFRPIKALVRSTGSTIWAPPKPRSFKWINPLYWWDVVSRWWGGRFGVNGEHFRLAFVLREALEIGLQTYQVNQLSRSVSRASINTLAVVTVVLNCFSSPIALYAVRKGEALNRFIGLMADMMLDICTAVVIPFAVVYPYIIRYNTETGFPPELSTNDAWFMGMTEEVRQYCVTSIVDYFASLMPHVSVYGCLKVAQRMIQKNPARSASSPSSPAA